MFIRQGEQVSFRVAALLCGTTPIVLFIKAGWKRADVPLPTEAEFDPRHPNNPMSRIRKHSLLALLQVD